MTRSAMTGVALWIVAIAAAVAVIFRAQFTADLSAFLPRAPTAAQRLLVNQLREGPAARLILLAVEGGDAAMRASVSKALARRLRQNTGLTSIANGEEFALERDREFLFEHRYLLSEAVTAERFSVTGLRSAIHESIDLLASPVGLLAKSLMPRDPTGELLQILESLDTTPRPASVDGVWVSSDGRRALLVARTRAAGSDTDGQERIIADIRRAFASAVRDVRGMSAAAMHLEMTGPAVFSVDARDTIKHEAVRLSILSTALIMLILLAVYRSATALLLGLLPVLTGALVGVAAVAIGFGIVHGITLGFGITLIGESVDYSIYLFIQSRQPGSDPAGSTSWVREYWPTVRLGMLTSVIGFASLLPSAFPGLAQLGLFSVAGLIAAAIVTRFVLPSILPRQFTIRNVAPLGNAIAACLRHRTAPRYLLTMVPLLALGILYSHRDTLWNRDLSALSPISSKAQRVDSQLRRDIGAPDVNDLVVVSGTDLQSALRAAEAVGAALDRLVDAGVIASFETPMRLLPSLAIQRERLAALPASPQLRERLKSALLASPLRVGRLEPFLRDIETARTSGTLTRADLEGTSLAALVDALLIPSETGWNVLLPLHATNFGSVPRQIDVSRVRSAIEAAAPEHAVVIDLKHELDALYSDYIAEAVHLSLAGLAAIIALLLLTLRSATRVMRTVAPLLLAVLVVAAVLVLCGRQLTILHLIGMLLIVAVGSNYALFFNRPYDAKHAADLMLASLVIANAATVTAFGVLAFSSVPVLQALGSTVAPGALLALLFSALLAGSGSLPGRAKP